MCTLSAILSLVRGMAQPGSATGLGPVGREFKSLCPDHFYLDINNLPYLAMFKGLFTAVITPFNTKYQLDLESFAKLVKCQKDAGVDGIVVTGSTGESASVTNLELAKLLEIATEFRSAEFKIIASVGTNSTTTTLEKLEIAKSFGVDGVMVVNPYYNRPTEDGLLAHFRVVAEASNCPIIVYNVPARTGSDIPDELIAQLFRIPNICCLKDATSNLARPANLARMVGAGTKENPSVTQLSGEDPTAVAFNAMGGSGLISVSSNIIPGELKEIQSLMAENNFEGALALHLKYNELHKALFCETNPGPIKYAAFKMGLISSPTLRLPLAELRPESAMLVEKAISNCVKNAKLVG